MFTSYRPQHEVHENYQTSGHHTYIGCDSVRPGETAKVNVRLITPQVYPRCIWEGRSLRVLEGTKHVGNLLITRVWNPLLCTSPGKYEPQWVEPTGLGSDLRYEGWEND